MNRLEQAFGYWMLRLRWWILLLVPLTVFTLSMGMVNLKFTSSYKVFFDEDNPQLLAFERMENAYTKDDNILFLLVPKDGEVFTPQVLAATELLTELAWRLPYSLRVDSITNFQHTEADGDDLVVRNLIQGAAGLSPQELARVRAIALSEPQLLDRLVPSAANVTAVNVTIQLPGVNETLEVPEVMKYARRFRGEIEAQFPAVDIRISGMVAMNNAFSEASQSDMRVLVPVSFGVMLVFLGVLLRSMMAVFATLLVIFFSILSGMGALGWLGWPITPATAGAPTAILTLAIASSVHLLATFFQELRGGSQRREALIESLRLNLQPVFLTSLTTAIGFLSLNVSNIPPFRHLGTTVAIGVMASFVLTVTFLPALMSILPVRAGRESRFGIAAMEKLGDFVVHRRTPLLWGMGALVLLLVAFLPRNQLNDIFVHYFDQSVEFRRDADFLDAHLGGLYRIDYSLASGEVSGIGKPEFLSQVEEFAQWLRSQPEVVHVSAITDTFKRLNKNLHGDDPVWYRLPEDRELAAQYLLLYEMFLPYGLDLNNQVDVNKSSTRLRATIRVISTNELLALERRAQDWFDENAPALKTQGASPTLMFSHVSTRNIKSMLVGTSVALVLISMILVIALRSVRVGLLSMVPNLAPAAMGFGIWGLVVGEVGLSLSVVTGMTLGVVVDDTVHFLSKYLRAQREHGMNAPQAVKYAFSRVGVALLITTVVLMAGFLVLALSSFEINAGMGLLTAMVLGLALLADFLFLPPLLLKLEEKRNA